MVIQMATGLLSFIAGEKTYWTAASRAAALKTAFSVDMTSVPVTLPVVSTSTLTHTFPSTRLCQRLRRIFRSPAFLYHRLYIDRESCPVSQHRACECREKQSWDPGSVPRILRHMHRLRAEFLRQVSRPAPAVQARERTTSTATITFSSVPPEVCGKKIIGSTGFEPGRSPRLPPSEDS